MVWPENISGGGSGGEVEAINPLVCLPYSSSMTRRSSHPLPSEGTGAARRKEAGVSPPSMPLCHGFRAKTRRP